jgi:peroxiredoxin
MKQIALNMLLLSVLMINVQAGGYEIGDKASDFKLKNVDGKFVSLSDFKDARGFIIVFTCNGCPYAQAYQDRIIELNNRYLVKGFPVIAINSNDTDVKPDDSLEGMKERAKEKGFTFPYLKDPDQEVSEKYGATKTPHVFLLKRSQDGFRVAYIGAIDDNYQDASEVREPYLANAVDALLAGKEPDPNFTKAIGCSIKTKEK